MAWLTNARTYLKNTILAVRTIIIQKYSVLVVRSLYDVLDGHWRRLRWICGNHPELSWQHQGFRQTKRICYKVEESRILHFGDRASLSNLLQMKPTRCTLLLSIFISTSVHVSGNYVPIIRRTYCIYATLVFFTLYGCDWHPKHVEWTFRTINRLLCVASCWTIINTEWPKKSIHSLLIFHVKVYTIFGDTLCT